MRPAVCSMMHAFLLITCGLLPCACTRAADAGPQTAFPPPDGFDFDIRDGLYATITAESYDAPKIQNEEKLKLKPKGFAKDIEVRALWQAERRPLAVLIPGMVDCSYDKETQLWKSYLQQAGFNVLTFDSPFLPSFNNRSRHGVIGNLVVEAWVVSDLIQAFLDQPKAKERVSEVGLVGLSYGGTLALNIARLVAEKKIGLPPGPVLAFSPPVRMRSAAERLDAFYAECRHDYKLVDLARDLSEHKPVKTGEPIPFSDSEMKAGIAVLFRFGLKGVVLYDDYRYKLGFLPKEQDEYRRDLAGTWTFKQFVEQMAVPYWATRSGIRTVDDYWAPGDLLGLLKDCPDSVRVILAADDPLNEPAELEALRTAVDPARLTVLPRGGHLGYGRIEWTRKRVARLFDGSGHADEH